MRLAKIRNKLIDQLEKEIAALPENIGTETSVTAVDGGTGKSKRTKTTAWKLRDLAAAYQSLKEEDFKREKLEMERQKQENESW